MANERNRQTYFGTLNSQTKEFIKFILREYGVANRASTIDSVAIKYLRNKFHGKRMVFIWAGATYHKSREIKEFLAVVSQGKAANEWELTCMLLPPNCPVA
jgi:hypothetical protein